MVEEKLNRLLVLEAQFGTTEQHARECRRAALGEPLQSLEGMAERPPERVATAEPSAVADLARQVEELKRKHRKEKRALQRALSDVEMSARNELVKYTELLEEALAPLRAPTVDVMLKLTPRKRRQHRKGAGHAIFFNGDFLAKHRINGFESGIAWGELSQQVNKVSVAKVAGIYFLLDDDDRVIYVGKSKNVLARVGSHLYDERKSPYISRVAGVAVPPERLDEVERLYIKLYSPPFNAGTDAGIEYLKAIQRKRKAVARKMRAHPEVVEELIARQCAIDQCNESESGMRFGGSAIEHLNRTRSS